MNIDRERKITARLKAALSAKIALPIAMAIFLAIQPLFDIASYWLSLNSSSATSLAGMIRLLLAISLVLLSFASSRYKKLYITTAAILASLAIARYWSNPYLELPELLTDISNVSKWLILPLLTLSYIDILTRKPNTLKYILAAAIVSIAIIFTSVAIAVVTGTHRETYWGTGVVGWFTSANAQSLILVTLAFIAPAYGYVSKNIKLFIIPTLLVSILCIAIGTRAAYFGAILSLLTWIGALALSRVKSPSHYAPLAIIAVTAALIYPHTPMASRAEGLQYVKDTRDTAADYNTPVTTPTKDDNSMPATQVTPNDQGSQLGLYEKYIPFFVAKFGYKESLEAFNHATQPSELMDNRYNKTKFALEIFNKSSTPQKLFGHTYSHFKYKGDYLTPEQDYALLLAVFGLTGVLLPVLYVIATAVATFILFARIIRRPSPTLTISIVTATGSLLIFALTAIGGHLANQFQTGVYWTLLLAISVATASATGQSKDGATA